MSDQRGFILGLQVLEKSLWRWGMSLMAPPTPITLIKKLLPISCGGGSECLQSVGWDPELTPEPP